MASRRIVDACWFVFVEGLKVVSMVKKGFFAWFSGDVGWTSFVGLVVL